MSRLPNWWPEELQQYRRDREAAAEEWILSRMDRKPGLVIESCRTFNPHRDWQTPCVNRIRR
jgi:hypothetical protein